jgi:hypothetical protein
MKYIIMMFGDQAGMLESRSVEWIREMIQFMHKLNDDLSNAGELVSAEGLADASQAVTVRFLDGAPVPTDGPYAESKEALAGFWIVDVENEARAIEIASRVVAYIECPVELRQLADRPPDY